MIINKQWIYQKRPQELVSEEHYQFQEIELNTQLAANEVIIEALYISVDPYMRIQQAASNTWEKPHPLGVVQGAAVVAKVIKSNSPSINEGSLVTSYSGWQTHAKLHASEVQLIESSLTESKVSLSSYLGILGMPGRTAWFGTTEVLQPKVGNTVVVSGASGAVGSLVAQYATLAGAQVIGIVGDDEKGRWLKQELGIFETINYRKFDTNQALQNEILKYSNGVDRYFDNVGGWITDAVIPIINKFARIIICGQISQYNGNLDQVEQAPRFLHHMLYQRATIQGLLARDFAHRMDEMVAAVSPLIEQQRVKFKESAIEGFENLPKALSSLFGENKNLGKVVVKL